MIINQQLALLIIRCSMAEQNTMEIDKHFIKEKLDCALICTPYVLIEHQLTDVLTKGLCSNVFYKNISKLM